MTGWQVGAACALGAPGLGLGTLLVLRRQRVVGALLVALGLLPLAVLSPDPVAGGAAPRGLALVLAVASVAGWVWLYVPPALLAAVFPDGHLGRRWWVLPVGWALFLATFHVAVALDPATYGPRPGQIPGEPPTDAPGWVHAALGVGSLVLLLALLLGSVLRVVLRFREGDPMLRRQLKWFLLAVLLLPAVLVATWAAYLVTDVAEVVVVAGLLLVYVALPVAVAIGVLRHDLYDIDTLVSRALAWTTLTAALLVVFTAVTVALGVALGRGSDLAVAAATLVCAILFGLLRKRVQASVDGRFDRDRHDALALLDRFVDQIRDGSADPEQVESALQRAVRDPGLRVVYALGSPPGATTFWCAGDGTPASRPEGRALDVAVAGRLVARIGYDEAARRPRLFREALRRAHLPLELAHSRLALRRALEETRASRARLVEAGDAERRRIERDLHDGAQQRLVAIGMNLRLAQQRAGAGAGDRMHDVLGEAVRDLQSAVGELRALAGGVRPAGLDEGLPAAVRGLVRTSPVPVAVTVTSDPVPQPVATTAYYVAAEALANALKHADPRSVSIEIQVADGGLRVAVTDDGRGGATVAAGSGLAGLRDRVAATGGRLAVASTPGAGTRVEARLPCGS